MEKSKKEKKKKRNRRRNWEREREIEGKLREETMNLGRFCCLWEVLFVGEWNETRHNHTTREARGQGPKGTWPLELWRVHPTEKGKSTRLFALQLGQKWLNSPFFQTSRPSFLCLQVNLKWSFLYGFFFILFLLFPNYIPIENGTFFSCSKNNWLRHFFLNTHWSWDFGISLLEFELLILMFIFN